MLESKIMTEIEAFSKELRDVGKSSCSVPVFQNAEQQDSGNSKTFSLTLILH